jgi:phosphate:Na+ symporter
MHLAFNFALAVLALPFVKPMMALVSKVLPDASTATLPFEASALDPAALDRPSRGLDCAARELLRMGHKIEQMLRAVGLLYDTWDETGAKAIRQQDEAVKQMHFDVKIYLARLGRSGLDEDLSRRSMELATISTSLEAASDAITRNMLQLARRLNTESVKFSEQGRQEIDDFSDRVLSNVQLALNVMMNQNPGEARELVAAKEKVRSIEQRLQRNHLGRLRTGLVDSIETSNVHQETLRALKQVNTSFSMVGYPILSKSGDLLDSRLAEI